MIRRLAITGRVQNVSYRQWFCGQAKALGLDGWVRNRADGSVEAVVSGPDDKVSAMVERARGGPPAASVAQIALHDDAIQEAFGGFTIRPTR